MKTFFAATAALAMISAAGSAHASMLGDTVSCGINGGSSFTCSSPTAAITSGVEFQVGNMPSYPYFNLDFSNGMLTVTALADNTLGATILDLQDLTTPFTSAQLTAQSGFTGLDAGDVSLAAGDLQIDMRGTSSVAGASFTLALPGGVPEPATWAMMISGFGLVGAAARQARTRAKLSLA